MTKLYLDIKTKKTDLDKLDGLDGAIEGMTDEESPRYIYNYDRIIDLLQANIMEAKDRNDAKAKATYIKNILPEVRKKRCEVLIGTIDRFVSQS